MKTKEVKKTISRAVPTINVAPKKLIKKEHLRIRELIETNPTIWQLTWVFLWRVVVLGFCLYFFIGIFIFLVAVFVNNLAQLIHVL